LQLKPIGGDMRAIFFVCLGLFVSESYMVSHGQVRQHKVVSAQRGVSDIVEQPRLGVEFSKVAKIKLATRKVSYRIGEMISLDVAILNTSVTPVFFHKLSGPLITISARDESGTDTPVFERVGTLEATAPESYSLIEPNEILIGRFDILSSCALEELTAFDKRNHEFDLDVHNQRIGYGKGLFERDLFVNVGYACLSLKRPGTYMFFIEVNNKYVITSRGAKQFKTAVGTFKSEPLTIAITE